MKNREEAAYELKMKKQAEQSDANIRSRQQAEQHIKDIRADGAPMCILILLAIIGVGVICYSIATLNW